MDLVERSRLPLTWHCNQIRAHPHGTLAHEDRAVWAVNVALALASGSDGCGCHHTLHATARLVADMLLLRYGPFGCGSTTMGGGYLAAGTTVDKAALFKAST